jgi:hypothetical protein
MAFGDVVRGWFRRERGEAGELAAEAERRIDAELSRRETELQATPEQRIDLLRDQIAANDADLEAIRRRAAGDRGDQEPDGH